MNASQLFATTMDPEKRCMVQITRGDAMEADKVFTTLMSDNVDDRRKWVFANARFASDLDV